MGIEFLVSMVTDGNVDERFGKGTDEEKLAAVKENRNKLLKSFGDGCMVVRMNAQHGTRIETVAAGNKELFANAEYGLARPNVDALITDQTDVVLECDPADCGVYALYSPLYELLSLVHAGRAGTVSRLLEKTIQAGADKRGVQVRDYARSLEVQVAPMVCGLCFQQEYLDIPFADYELWKNHMTAHEGLKTEDMLRLTPFPMRGLKTFGVDIGGYNKQRLLNLGVHFENITDSTICTAQSKDYFSHMYEPEGRFMVAARMTKE